jgi:hypothetical protein
VSARALHRAELPAPRGRHYAAVGVVAVVADLTLVRGAATLAGALLVVAASASLLASGALRTPAARVLAAVAPVFGIWLVLRESAWLVPLDVAAATLLLGGAVLLAGGGRIADLGLGRVVAGACSLCAYLGAAPVFLARPLAGRMRQLGARPEGVAALVPVAAVARGLLVATPLVLVLGALLASADVVFAHFLRVPADPAPIGRHAAYGVVGALGMASLVLAAGLAAPPAAAPARRPVGRVEAGVILIALDLLFGAFAVAQVVAISAGGRHVIETAGLTYAEYARSGFFQLAGVATVTLAVLSTLSARARRGRTYLLLAETAVVLTLVIVVVAFRRLQLYEDAYGFTMLRLFSHAFTVWIGIAFVLLGVAIAGVGGSGRWFFAAAVGSGLVILLGLNAINAEAWIVRANAARARAGAEIDAGYLRGLSADAVPAIAAEPALAGTLDCAVDGSGDALSYNRAAAAAAGARARACRQR